MPIPPMPKINHLPNIISQHKARQVSVEIHLELAFKIYQYKQAYIHCVQKKTPTHIFLHISMDYLWI